MMIDHGEWDVVVVGAGPAGSIAAREAARLGARVLLVDRSAFPRDKVCGGCVNAGAAKTLADVGLGGLLTDLGAKRVTAFRLYTPGARSTVRLPGGWAVSRAAFDLALVEAAQTAGARFADRTSAHLIEQSREHRSLRLQSGDETIQLRARVVIAADGLSGRLLADEPGMSVRVSGPSYMGASTIVDHAAGAYESGVIHMATGRRGYVGLVRLEDDRLNIAAAFDPAFAREAGGPGAAAAALLAGARLPAIANMTVAPWQGTALLTRRRAAVAGRRLIVAGDAAGYVEPFTGEGIAWALGSGRAAAALAVRAAAGWSDDLMCEWSAMHQRMIRRRQRWCRAVTAALRWPGVTRVVSRVLSVAPILARPVVRAINAPLGEAGAMGRALRRRLDEPATLTLGERS